MKYIFPLLLLCTTAFAQKTQSVTVKTTTKTLIVKAGANQSFTINYPGGSVVVNPPKAADTSVYLKDYKTFDEAASGAIKSGKTLIFPSAYYPDAPLHIRGNLKISAVPGSKVFAGNLKSDYLVYIHQGAPEISNLEFVAADGNTTMSTVQTEQSDIEYNPVFTNCSFSGPWYINYQSSAGYSTTTFIRCRFFANYENIQYYSQMGPKTLILLHDTLQALTSHCIYSHPINNYLFNDVLFLGAAINAMNSYGTAESVTTGINSFQKFKNCRAADTARGSKTGTPLMFRLSSSYSPIYIDSCTMAPYEVSGKVFASNSHFFNAGNGAALGADAEVTNCTGDVQVRDGQSITVKDSRLSSFSAGSGSKVFVSNTSIQGVWAHNHRGTYTKCTIGDYDLFWKGDFTNDIIFSDCSINVPTYKRLRLFNHPDPGKESGLTFIRTPTPPIDNL